MLRLKGKELKKKIKENTTNISKKGYKGGYFVRSDMGWNNEVDTIKELIELLFKELNKEKTQEQKIDVALFQYDNLKKEYTSNIEERYINVWDYEDVVEEFIKNDIYELIITKANVVDVYFGDRFVDKKKVYEKIDGINKEIFEVDVEEMKISVRNLSLIKEDITEKIVEEIKNWGRIPIEKKEKFEDLVLFPMELRRKISCLLDFLDSRAGFNATLKDKFEEEIKKEVIKKINKK